MTKHKHYYCIRAFADGWEIEEYINFRWCQRSNPIFHDDALYRVASDKDGWLPWYGGKCPVPLSAIVEFSTPEKTVRAYGDLIHWDTCINPVIKYRLISNGWLPWFGGECPVDVNTMVQVIIGNIIYCSNAGKFDWNYDIAPITRYCIIEKSSKFENDISKEIRRDI